MRSKEKYERQLDVTQELERLMLAKDQEIVRLNAKIGKLRGAASPSADGAGEGVGAAIGAKRETTAKVKRKGETDAAALE